ncbi:MAG: arylsulfatase [Planctomycetota bacterium]
MSRRTARLLSPSGCTKANSPLLKGADGKPTRYQSRIRCGVQIERRFKMKNFLAFLLLLLPLPLAASERPNIILIMVDDMGFSDLGYHGGEINTPNIDALAHGGVRFSQFYNSGRCCPTRATLMTGNHPHQTGIGHMTLSPNKKPSKKAKPPAYQGYLNEHCVTISQSLKRHGYATLMAGKWHLGQFQRSCWPLQRGFDKYFGCIAGSTRFFHPEHPRGMTLGNEHVPPASTTNKAFYTTDAYTDHAIGFLSEHQADEATKPFFLYLAYTAPHWPLQAFEEDIAKYRGKYTQGWDALRESRFQRQLESGLLRQGTKLSPRTSKIPDWDSLGEDKRDEMDLKMAVYAAMVDRVDQNVGKLVTHLKRADSFDNTLILFLSDNGGCQEGGMLGRGEFYDVGQRNQQTNNSYGEAWANASNTPFRLYKHFAHEGGTSTPFFMHWPEKIQPRKDWYRSPAQLIDIVPTLLDVAGATHPDQLNGNAVPALDGISLRSAFTGDRLDRSEPICVEHENNAFVRDGDWKLVGRGVSPAAGIVHAKWELYDIANDRTETTDLAKSHPALVKKMSDHWAQWARRVNVYPKTASKR